MKIRCFRCDKKIDTPGFVAKRILTNRTSKGGKPIRKIIKEFNADYIIAEDTKSREMANVLVALAHNPATLEKQSRGEEIADEEYDAIIVTSYEEAQEKIGEDLVKVIIKTMEVEIQKTGIICPGCYRPTDFVIWGAHK